MANVIDFNAQNIYNEIIEAQREIQNTRDAYDLEIQACKEQNSILIQEIVKNQTKLKKCFALQYEYAQIPRFDKNKTNWTFFDVNREAEILHINAKCDNWSSFLKVFGAYCRRCNLENDFCIVDLLTYSTIPALFSFLSDLEISDDFNSPSCSKKNTPKYMLFTDFILNEFFFYEAAKKNHLLQNRFETLVKFSRSVFVWPPFLHFVHVAFSPIIKKFRSYFSSILSVEKPFSNDIIVNTTDCLIKNLLQELKNNINLCPPEISYFLKSIQISISSFISASNSDNSNEKQEKNGDDIGLKHVADLFYINFLSLIFTEPRIFFITDAHNDDSLFKTDSKFEEKLREASILFVQEIIKPQNELKKLPQLQQTMPKYILIDNYDKKILEMSKDDKKLKYFKDSLTQIYQIKQYHLFKVALTEPVDIVKMQKKKSESIIDSDDDDTVDNPNEAEYNKNDENVENTDIDFLNYSFNGKLLKNDTILQYHLAESLYMLIAYAPPLPKCEIKIDESTKDNLFINVIQKVLFEDIYSLKNATKRQTFLKKLYEMRDLFPKKQKELKKLFEAVKLRANPNSRLTPSKLSGNQKNLSINDINIKMLKKRADIKKERKQIYSVYDHESKVLYITLFRRFLSSQNNINSNLNELKNEFVKKSQLFRNYFTNEKCFPIESPTCIELAINPTESRKCFSFISKLNSLFSKEIGIFKGANEVVHSSFYRNLSYYSYLIAKPQLIAKDAALSERFEKCQALSQKSNCKGSEDEINSCANFFLPIKVLANMELFELPRKIMFSAFSDDEVPLKKVVSLSKAFKEVINAFLLTRTEDIVEVIAYTIASLHAMHFTSCYEFINDFLNNSEEDNNVNLDIFTDYEAFFILLHKVSKRLTEGNSVVLKHSEPNSIEQIDLFTQSIILNLDQK